MTTATICHCIAHRGDPHVHMDEPANPPPRPGAAPPNLEVALIRCRHCPASLRLEHMEHQVAIAMISRFADDHARCGAVSP